MGKPIAWLVGLMVLPTFVLAVVQAFGPSKPTAPEVAETPGPAPIVARASPTDRTVVQVELSSPRSEYLIGEPVDLRIVLTNVSGREFRRFDPGDEYLDQVFRVWYSHDGKGFQQYSSGVGQQSGWDIGSETYRPGDVKYYQIDVLYQREGTNHLALEQPGRYRFKVDFPLPSREGHLHKPFRKNPPRAESNTIEIRLKEPVGEDVRVFEVIRQPKYLYFIQTGWAGDRENLFSMEAVELLRTHPKTGYGRALRRGLAKYYESPTFYDNLEAREQIRQVLGIETNVLFPEDRRLDREFELTLTEKTSIPDAVRMIAKQCGFPLDASPELSIKAFEKGMISLKPLRVFMQRYNGQAIGAYWERRGDGYYLTKLRFPDDRRLGRSLLVYYPDPTPLAEVFRFVSKRCSASLEASAELRDRRVQLTAETNVHTLMRRLSHELNAIWVRRGEGYYLTRKPENPKPNPGDQTKSQTNP